MEDSIVRKRDRKRTMTKILMAVGQLIKEQGLPNVGINLVARTSGVNKVLIYRYFGSIDGLLDEYVSSVFKNSAYFRRTVPQAASLKEVLKIMLIEMLHDLRSDTHLRALLRWEMQFGKSVLRAAYSDLFRLVIQKAESAAARQQISAFIALISSGMYHLVTIGDYGGILMDVDLSKDQDWKLIEQTIEMSLESFPGLEG